MAATFFWDVHDQPVQTIGEIQAAGSLPAFLRQPALADPVRLGYAEVARRRRLFRLDLRDGDGAEDGQFSGAIGSSGCGSAHSCIASSHAAW